MRAFPGLNYYKENKMEEKKEDLSAFNGFNHLILLTIAKYLSPKEIVSSFLKLN